MAVVLKNNEDDKEKEGQEGAQPQQTNTGASGSITASASPVAPATPDQAKKGSGQFTNLKNYIQANRNFNAAGGGLAGKVAGNIETQGRDVEAQIGGAKEAFTQQKTQALEPIRQGAQLTQQAVANPMQFAQNQQNVQAVQAARDAEYKGPRSLADLQGRQSQAALQGQTQDFTTKVQQGQTEQGRFNLLRNMFARPSYSTGQQNLDNLLIQGQRDQIQRIADTGRTAARVNQQLRQNIDQAAQMGQQATQEARNIQQETRGALNQRVLQERDAINTALQQAKQQQDRELYRLASGFERGVVDQDLADKIGLTSGQRIYDTTVQDLISRGALARGVDPTAQSVVSAENVAQLNALRNLIGQQASGEAGAVLQDFTKAGDFDPSNFIFNQAGIQSREQKAAAESQNILNQVRNQISKNNWNLDPSTINVERQNQFLQTLGDVPVEQSFANYIRSGYGANQNHPDIAGLSDQQIIQKFTSSPRSANTILFQRAKDMQNQLGLLNRIRVGQSSVDDFDAVDPRTGLTRGQTLLQRLGLARRTENV